MDCSILNKNVDLDLMEKISIITPLYNSEKYIANTIISVLNQTYKNWELLVVDDFSSDNSSNIVLEFMKNDSRIKLFRNQKNLGAAISRNIAIKNANGTYISFLDSDDEWHPKKLEKQIKFMTENNILFSYTNYFEKNNKKLYLISGPKIVTPKKLNRACWMGCLTVIYNREEIGLVQIPDLKRRNDYALWLKIINKADCYLLSETLAFYNKRKNSISDINILKKMKYAFLIYRKISKKSKFVSYIYTLRTSFWSIAKKVLYKRVQKNNDKIIE